MIKKTSILYLSTFLFSFVLILFINNNATGLRYSMDTNLSMVDVTFQSEREGDGAYLQVNGGGDVNGDGYDDFLIGYPWSCINNESSGKVYLIFGKNTSWDGSFNLSNSSLMHLR